MAGSASFSAHRRTHRAGLARTRVTADQVTLLGLVIGLVAGHLFVYTSPWLNAAGFVLFIISDIFDSADGQLARLRGTSTPLGRILDGTSDAGTVHQSWRTPARSTRPRTTLELARGDRAGGRGGGEPVLSRARGSTSSVTPSWRWPWDAGASWMWRLRPDYLATRRGCGASGFDCTRPIAAGRRACSPAPWPCCVQHVGSVGVQLQRPTVSRLRRC